MNQDIQIQQRQKLIKDFVRDCVLCVDPSLIVPNLKVRNTNIHIAAFNKTTNSIIYHSDLLFLKDIKFIKMVLAHEVAHYIVGYEYGHNELWRSCCDIFEEVFDVYPITEYLDEKSIPHLFDTLKPGLFLEGLFDIVPELNISDIEIGFSTVGSLVGLTIDEQKLLFRPTLFCMNDKRFLTELDKEDLEDYICDFYNLEDN